MTTSFSVVAVGDLMVGDTAISVGYGFGSSHDAESMRHAAERIRPLLANGDVVFGNLECTLSRDGYDKTDWRSAQMRGHPSYADALRAAGFTVVSVANNHAHQHGVSAFHETVEMLERAGMQVCGLRGDDGWCARPVRIVARHVVVGVLAYSLRPRQYGSATPPYAEGTESSILADVSRLRREVPSVVVSLHWGEEYGPEPSAEEVRLGHAVIDAGARIIIGHHPHVVRPVERYRNGVIAYSLGNFLADMLWQEEFRRTVVLRCAVGDDIRAELTAARIGDDFVPALASPRHEHPVDSLAGLSADAYRRQTARTESIQRRRSYAYALRHLLHSDARVMRTLLGTTLRNKWQALTG